MNFQVTIGFNADAFAAIEALTAAIRGISGSSAAPAASATSSAAAVEAAENGPIYWADNETGLFGEVDSEAAYKALKKKSPGIHKIPDTMYERKLAEKQAAEDAAAEDAAAAKKEAADKKAAAKKEAAAKKAAEDAAAAKKETASGDAPEASEEELVAAFQSYLPKDLSKEERAERHAFVKPLLQRFGASRATELPAEHRALAINLVLRKAAGEDVDPETAEYAAIELDEEDVI